MTGAFRRDWLPSWETYAAQYDIALTGRGAQRRTQCPIHGGSRDSLTINVVDGPWECKACGAHGGDVLGFHRALHGGGFIEAAQALGAWDAGDGAPREPSPPAPDRSVTAEPALPPQLEPQQHQTLSGLRVRRSAGEC